jgi:glycerol-3-phosphate acyltransferase PlsY
MIVYFLKLIGCIVAAYLIGSIPFAYLYGKIVKNEDIRDKGSGNPGATNVLRIYGKGPGFLVLFLDMLKGYLPLYLCRFAVSDPGTWFPVLIAILAILGHTFSPFLNFKGGKGVATSAGVMLCLSWEVTLAALFIFTITVFVSKYVSLGSIMAVLFLIANTIMNYTRAVGRTYTEDYDMSGNIFFLVFVILLGVFVIYKHSSNIGRLIRGTENKISFK